VSGRNGSRRNSRAHNKRARTAPVNRGRAVGLGFSATAVVALGINTFGGTPAANADDPYVALTIGGVGDGVDEIAVSPVGPESGDIYVASPVGRGEDYVGTLSVIDPSSNTIVHTIDIGPGYDGQLGLAVSATGPAAGDIYVTDPDTGTLSVIDPSTNAIVDTISIGPGENGPLGVAVSPTGPEAGDIYATPYEGDTVSVIDPSTNTIAHTIEIDGSETTAVAISPTGPDAGDIYVGDLGGVGGGEVSVIDPSTNTVVHTINLGAIPIGLTVSPTGPEAGDIYVIDNSGDDAVSVIDPSTNAIVHTIDVGGQPDQLAISTTGPDAGDIYVTLNGQCATCMAVIDPSTNTVTAAYTIDGNVGWASAVGASPTGPEAGDIYATDGSNLLVIPGDVTGPPSTLAELLDPSSPTGVLNPSNLTGLLDPASYGDNSLGYLVHTTDTYVIGPLSLAAQVEGVHLGTFGDLLGAPGAVETVNEFESHWDGYINGDFGDAAHIGLETTQLEFTAAAAITEDWLPPLSVAFGTVAFGAGGLDTLLSDSGLDTFLSHL
jgi:YVTN family beta-propeller protein